GPEREGAPHAHRGGNRPVTDQKDRKKADRHPAEWKRIGESEFMRPDDSARGEKQSGQHEEPRRKPPREMQGGKLPCRQVAPARAAQRVQKKSRKTIFRPDEPRRDEKEKGDKIRPMEKKPETETGFAKE